MILSRRILLRMRTVSDKLSRGKQNTYFMLNNFIAKSRAVYEIMWKNIVEPDRLQTTI